MTIVHRAVIFAIRAHGMQERKYTGAPYWTHCEEVANTVKVFGGTPEMIAAAWLHDTVEDTETMIEDIGREFGPEVARLVAELTDVSRLEDGNRAARKAIDRAHIVEASPEGRAIKLADLIDNTRSIAAHDPDFARVYLPEKRAILDAVEGTPGCEELEQLARETLAEAWVQTFGEAMP